MNATLRLDDIKIDRFEFLAQESSENKISYEKYEFEFSNTITLFDKYRVIKSEFTVKLYETQDANTKLPLVLMLMTTHFGLENFNDIIVKEENQLKVPNPLLGFINNLVIDNARGIFVAKLENTRYSNALLPLILLNPGEREGSTVFTPSIPSNA